MASLSDNTETDEEEDDEAEEVPEVKAHHKKKVQRAGVSAEVYGKWNKKGDFVAKVVAKSA